MWLYSNLCTCNTCYILPLHAALLLCTVHVQYMYSHVTDLTIYNEGSSLYIVSILCSNCCMTL